ncbi:Aste57867_18910 [Aphanomyces stellatus]|uniref:Aste57867_18910 protein n=1 Tax=Aphanomyces stellatus TaxID=120398 RepID=A0A485LBI7_9STRA|nr:hypothetical protein As57867_018846 [Aphanomyces stellatus]VFT95642.1 Aste57867_18910 [Aphanomyces stellatus]
MSEDYVVSPATAANDAATLLKKRMRQTKKMQRYRKRLIEKAEVMRDHIASLETEIAEYMQRRPSTKAAATLLLPWKEVARALKDDGKLADKDNRALQQQCQAQRMTILAIKHWMTEATTIVKSPRGSTHTWRNVTLCAHPTSRQLGFDWITKQMHANTDAVLQQFHFPPLVSTDVVDDFTIDTTNSDFFQLVWRDQREVPYPLEDVRDLFMRPHFFVMVGGVGLPETTSIAERETIATDQHMLQLHCGSDTQYLHKRMLRAKTLVHSLVREFHEPNRCVFVRQSIHDDELLANDPLQRNRMTWFVLDRLGPKRTKIRALNLSSQQFAKGGVYVSLEEEAPKWGLDVRADDDADVIHRRLVQRLYHICSGGGSAFDQDLDDALRGRTQ